MTRPEHVRADTFELQSHRVTTDDPFQMKHDDMSFDGLGEEEDDIYDEDNDDDDDGDALSSSPSIPDDDIDFDSMYALHSFAATVEGQANATKGDVLVLLDDSNSYWWLVRVVKDHSVGYLPAETIETPQERLARLNKHRNIDRTAVMLEDHSPTSRSSSRKPFRRKGAKAVIFNNSCTYYQLESLTYDTSDGEDDDEGTENIITEGQNDDYDQEVAEEETKTPEEKIDPMQLRKDELVEMDALIDSEVDAPHPSPRIGMDTVDVSDHAGRKVMRIRDLNAQVGERPTSAIFRDSKLEPLKISVTPSIARDRISYSPDETETTSTSKNKYSDRESERKRSLSVSSSANSESGADSDMREKDRDKKGRKNSVFGNLFRKKSRKSSKDEDTGREEDTNEAKGSISSDVIVEREVNEDETSSQDRWMESSSEKGRRAQNPETIAAANGQGTSKHVAALVLNTTELDTRAETPIASPDLDMDRHTSPATTQASSSLATPSLPWSDASVHSFLDNDTSIRDALVLIYEGSRLKRRSSIDPINPQIADLYCTCAVHIDEMSSHLDDVLMSYLFDVKA